MRANGRFWLEMKQIVEWISLKKRFSFVGPDYIVVGMEREEYNRLFAQKQRDFNYESFVYEFAKVSDEQWEKLKVRPKRPQT